MKPEDMINAYAILGARDQRSGYEYSSSINAFVESTSTDLHELKKIMTARKDSKARVIYMYNRAENYKGSEVLTPLTNMVAEDEKYFSAYLPTDRLLPKIASFKQLVDKLGLVSANIDFDSFDTTVSAEMLVIACMIVEQFIKDEKGRKVL